MRQTLADIEARHADIKKLEKSIVELHEMFVDMVRMEILPQQNELFFANYSLSLFPIKKGYFGRKPGEFLFFI